MTSKRENQHYVPQFYLRYFAFSPKKKTQVYTHDIHNNNKVFVSAIKNVAGEIGFYESSYGNAIESELADFEGKVASVWKKLVKGKLGELTEEDRVWIARFVSVLMVRTLAAKETHRDMIAGVREHFKKYDMEISPKLAEELDFLEETETEAVVDQIKSSDQFVPILLSLTWLFGTPPPGRLFPTSDNPVTRYNSVDPTSLGLLSPGIELHLPVSSKLVLIMVDIPEEIGKRFPERFQYQSENLLHFTNLLVQGASRFLFSQDGGIDFEDGMLRKGPRIVTN